MDWNEHSAHADSAVLEEEGAGDGTATAVARSRILAGAIRDTSYVLAAAGAQLTIGALDVDAASRKELLKVLGALITDARWMQRRIQAIRTAAPAEEA